MVAPMTADEQDGEQGNNADDEGSSASVESRSVALLSSLRPEVNLRSSNTCTPPQVVWTSPAG